MITDLIYSPSFEKNAQACKLPIQIQAEAISIILTEPSAGNIYFEFGPVKLKTISHKGFVFLFVDLRVISDEVIFIGVTESDGNSPPPPNKKQSDDLKKYVEKAIEFSDAGVSLSPNYRAILGKVFDTIEKNELVDSSAPQKSTNKSCKSSLYTMIEETSLWYQPKTKYNLKQKGFIKRNQDFKNIATLAVCEIFEKMWWSISSMTKEYDFYEHFAYGLNSYVDHKTGRRPLREDSVLIPVPDVKEIRTAMSLTQRDFAERYGLSLSAVRNWEQRKRTPEQAVALLLQLIKKYPEKIADDVRALKTTG